MSAQSAEGWLLHLNGDLRAAIGFREMLYVLPDEPRTYAVPGSPPHARCVIRWQEHLVPLIDLRTLLLDDAEPGAATVVGIVACNPTPGANETLTLGALSMQRAPERIQVHDGQACRLPDDLPGWRRVTAACFRHPQHGPVPILDLPALLTRLQD